MEEKIKEAVFIVVFFLSEAERTNRAAGGLTERECVCGFTLTVGT